MISINNRLPKNYHKRLSVLSSEEGISINQLITLAIGEKLSAIDTEGYIQDRANLASRSQFEAAHNKINDRNPESKDAL